MYPSEVIRRIMSGERNDRNETGDWMMCPVCGRGDDNDPDPADWKCTSCDPGYLDPRTDEYGWEKYPSCDMTTREGGLSADW